MALSRAAASSSSSLHPFVLLTFLSVCCLYAHVLIYSIYNIIIYNSNSKLMQIYLLLFVPINRSYISLCCYYDSISPLG